MADISAGSIKPCILRIAWTASGAASQDHRGRERRRSTSERTEIILQDAKLIEFDLGVCGVEVGHLDGVMSQASVGHVVIHRSEIGVGQGILLGEWMPAVLSLHEFVAQSKLEFRMIAQLADLLNSELRSQFTSHPQGIGVIESDTLGHDNLLLRQGSSHIRFVVDSSSLANRLGQDLFTDRTCIVDIDIDIAAEQGLPNI